MHAAEPTTDLHHKATMAIVLPFERPHATTVSEADAVAARRRSMAAHPASARRRSMAAHPASARRRSMAVHPAPGQPSD
jgi:hypothetical protein